MIQIKIQNILIINVESIFFSSSRLNNPDEKENAGGILQFNGTTEFRY